MCKGTCFYTIVVAAMNVLEGPTQKRSADKKKKNSMEKNNKGRVSQDFVYICVTTVQE